MESKYDRYAPGRVRDAIFTVLSSTSHPLTVKEIEDWVEREIGKTPRSSVRSYLRLNTPETFVREKRGVYRLKIKTVAATKKSSESRYHEEPLKIGRARLFHDDCFN